MKHWCTSGSPLWLDPDLRNKPGLRWTLGFPQATLGKRGGHFVRLTQTRAGFRRMGLPFLSYLRKSGILRLPACSSVWIGHLVALTSERPTYG